MSDSAIKKILKTNKDLLKEHNFNYNIPNSSNSVSINKVNYNSTVETMDFDDIKGQIDTDTKMSTVEVENKLNSMKENYTEVLNTISSDIDNVDKEIKAIESEINKIAMEKGMTAEEVRTYTLENGLFDIDYERLDNLKEQKTELIVAKTELTYQINQIDNNLEKLEYIKKTETDEYKKFIENYSNESIIDYDLLKSVGYDLNLYKSQSGDYSEIDALAVVEHLIAENPDMSLLKTNYPTLTDAIDLYNYTTQDQKDMYHYILAKEGKDAADKYLKVIEDERNQVEGAAAAEEFLSKINLDDPTALDDIQNYLNISGKGLTDGIETFGAGLQNAIINNDVLTAKEYETMLILQYLQEHSNLYDEVYEFNSSIGNMVPSIVASTIVSYAATPVAGAKVGSILMGLSAGGNAKHQSLVNGSNLVDAIIYGTLTGVSETCLQYLLGGIPGLGGNAATDATAKAFLKNMISEGIEEGLQEYVDAGLRAALYGEEINLDNLSGDALKSAIMGALSAGLIDGSMHSINVVVDGVHKQIDLNEQVNNFTLLSTADNR